MSNVVALVTGGSRGIGKATILEFAKAGVNVVINYNKHAMLAEAVKDEILNKYDVEVMCIKADISREEEVEEMVNQIIDQLVTEKGMDEEYAKTYLYGGGFTIYSTEKENIQEEMEENNLSKREATLVIELSIKFRMDDFGLTYEEAIMAMLEGW